MDRGAAPAGRNSGAAIAPGSESSAARLEQTRAIAHSPFQPGDRIICRYGPGTYLRIKENQALVQLDNGYHVSVDPLALFPEPASDDDGEQLSLKL